MTITTTKVNHSNTVAASTTAAAARTRSDTA